MTTDSTPGATETHGVGPRPLTADQLLRTLDSTLARLVRTGAIADSRAGLVISSNIGMLGALAASLSGSLLHTASAWVWLLLVLTAAACVASIAMAALAAFPRPGTQPHSLVFFGSIAAMERDTYFDGLRKVPQVQYADDLADQCHRVAALAALKFRWVRRAMATMMAAALPWLACLELLGRLRLQ